MPNCFPAVVVTRDLTECFLCCYYPYLAGIELKLVEETSFHAHG
jgi:hypothetical protein